ncbi:uracil-DNA glycosylase family protein [Cupriavidus basilensis]|uniref:uracil-DNA glycosylase family protein n=1 Tax=Cupriavidus basilensis TaxID=68895 RepID=UPI00130E681F|nr:uracil-DNA glycosylase family protein [Cupriavidus basilensis]
MADFEVNLKLHCNVVGGPYLRPFSPNTNWRQASCFIIGLNPATALWEEFSGFEEYWNGLTKEPELFYSRYRAKHRTGQTKTKKSINELTSLIGAEKCLVTNICWYPAPKWRCVPKRELRRHEMQLLKLIDYCQPRVLFFHGKDTVDFVERTYGMTLKPNVPPAEQNVQVGNMQILTYYHLSGLGRKKEQFNPGRDLPVFADRIRQHLQIA